MSKPKTRPLLILASANTLTHIQNTREHSPQFHLKSCWQTAQRLIISNDYKYTNKNR